MNIALCQERFLFFYRKMKSAQGILAVSKRRLTGSILEDMRMKNQYCGNRISLFPCLAAPFDIKK
jgi:hypothetical protein